MQTTIEKAHSCTFTCLHLTPKFGLLLPSVSVLLCPSIALTHDFKRREYISSVQSPAGCTQETLLNKDQYLTSQKRGERSTAPTGSGSCQDTVLLTKSSWGRCQLWAGSSAHPVGACRSALTIQIQNTTALHTWGKVAMAAQGCRYKHDLPITQLLVSFLISNACLSC